jgi:hypothetical protein
MAAANKDALGLVFFPHWESLAWLKGEPGIVLNQPSKDTVKEEIVSSDIRIFCDLPAKNLFEFVVNGRNVSKVTGRSTTIKSDWVRYYIE